MKSKFFGTKLGAVLVLTLALVATGCGDDEDDGDGTGGTGGTGAVGGDGGTGGTGGTGGNGPACAELTQCTSPGAVCADDDGLTCVLINSTSGYSAWLRECDDSSACNIAETVCYAAITTPQGGGEPSFPFCYWNFCGDAAAQGGELLNGQVWDACDTEVGVVIEGQAAEGTCIPYGTGDADDPETAEDESIIGVCVQSGALALDADCRQDSDASNDGAGLCTAGSLCLAPQIQNPPSCTSDAQCGEGQYCTTAGRCANLGSCADLCNSGALGEAAGDYGNCTEEAAFCYNIGEYLVQDYSLGYCIAEGLCDVLTPASCSDDPEFTTCVPAFDSSESTNGQCAPQTDAPKALDEECDPEADAVECADGAICFDGDDDTTTPAVCRAWCDLRVTTAQCGDGKECVEIVSDGQGNIVPAALGMCFPVAAP